MRKEVNEGGEKGISHEEEEGKKRRKGREGESTRVMITLLTGALE